MLSKQYNLLSKLAPTILNREPQGTMATIPGVAAAAGHRNDGANFVAGTNFHASQHSQSLEPPCQGGGAPRQHSRRVPAASSSLRQTPPRGSRMCGMWPGAN